MHRWAQINWADLNIFIVKTITYKENEYVVNAFVCAFSIVH